MKHESFFCVERTEVQAADLARVPGQRDDGPGRVGLHVPHLDGLVVAPAHDPAAVELDAGDAAAVALEGADVALSAHPGAAQLVPLHEHLAPVHLALLPPLQLGPAPLRAQPVLGPTENIS